MLKEGKKVPYLIIRYISPPHILDEFLKTIFEAAQKRRRESGPDPAVGEVVLAAVKATEQGYIFMNIFEAKEGKLDAAFALWRERMALLRNVEGFKHSIELWASVSSGEVSFGGIKIPPK